MPYVKQARRDAILERIIGSDGVGRKINATEIKDCGELNYAITEIFIEYFKNSKKNYQAVNDISGAATEALAEFRRRVTVDYEDGKIQENGDVYPEAKK